MVRQRQRPPASRMLPVRTHAHANWAFEAAGTYVFTVQP
ncbi:TIGR03769 domain-containing protein [Lentzea xinjiangensis]|nr:TIGR03769 domain-containing protein [Lentzea xinjiangensis]